MNFEFNYLFDKINYAKFSNTPFPHIEIKNFLNERHLLAIINDTQIKFQQQRNIEELFYTLESNFYEPIVGAGVTNNKQLYLNCLKSNNWPVDKNRVDRLGMMYSLKKIQNKEIEKLICFFKSEKFKKSLIEKFSINDEIYSNVNLIKYLDGYEISPHPDNRSKKLTFLLNINTDAISEKLDIHTHLLKLKFEKEFIYKFWECNPEYNRDLLPWNWAETKKIINENNTILFFSPNDYSLHGVKCNYNHLKFQRTQINGNFFIKNFKQLPYVKYDAFNIVHSDTPKYYPLDTRIDDFDKNLKIF